MTKILLSLATIGLASAYKHKMRFKVCGGDGRGGEFSMFCTPWKGKASNGGCYHENKDWKKGNAWTKTWSSDVDLYGEAFSSSYNRLQDMSLFGGDDDICFDYIRVGTQQSNGKYKLRWATDERFWLSGYRGKCWGEDTGRGGYPCYQDAIFGACGIKFNRDEGSDEIKGIQCAPSCEASCNDGEGWAKPADCSDSCPTGLNHFGFSRLLRAFRLDNEIEFSEESNDTAECLDNDDCADGQSCACNGDEEFLAQAPKKKGDAVCMCQ